MTDHALVGQAAAEYTAAAVRAELGRFRKTGADLAMVLDCTPHTAGRRLSGEVPLSVFELAAVASWLGISLNDLLPRPGGRQAAS